MKILFRILFSIFGYFFKYVSYGGVLFRVKLVDGLMKELFLMLFVFKVLFRYGIYFFYGCYY